MQIGAALLIATLLATISTFATAGAPQLSLVAGGRAGRWPVAGRRRPVAEPRCSGGGRLEGTLSQSWRPDLACMEVDGPYIGNSAEEGGNWRRAGCSPRFPRPNLPYAFIRGGGPPTVQPVPT